MPDAETMTADPFELATAAAIVDLQAALRATAPAVQAAEGAVGHGTIRLRDRQAAHEPDPELVEPRGVPTSEELPEQPVAAASGTAIGHGTIRLLGQSARPSGLAATTPEPAAAADMVAGGPGPGPAGHGAIRLRGRA